MSEEQKKAIADALANVRKAIVSAVEKATTEANKALGTVQKSLGK